jgi:hypothetical protein
VKHVKQSVKDTFLEIKNAVFEDKQIDLSFVSIKSRILIEDIKKIDENYRSIKNSLTNPQMHTIGKRLWQKCEDDMLLHYMKLAQKESIQVNGLVKKKTNNSILNEMIEIEVIPQRSESSIPFRFHQINPDKKPHTKVKTKGVKALSIVPSNEVEIIEVTEESTNKDDLLDIVVDTIDNLDTAGVDITELYKGILQLSRKAVENSNVEKVNNLEENVRVLKGRNNHLESELVKEQERSQKLQEELNRLINDISSVWQEIDQFERLTGKQKLKQINGHSTRMKYIVDKFCNVEVVS